MDYKEYCTSTYNYMFEQKYLEDLAGRTSQNAQVASERKAQHQAILYTFETAIPEYSSSASITKIWNAIYRAHLLRKVNITDIDDLDEGVVDAIISGAQSWKKCSGHVFEEYVVRATKERLSAYNIRLVLQKELSQMISDGLISNDESDQIPDIAHSDNFDIYAVVNVNGNNVVFGCVQAKTSIRDRVGRDRDFSAEVMNKNFWSAAVVLDGTYLAMPKFEKMVNGGGTTQYSENGWHGMYVLSDAASNDRIYEDKDLTFLVEDARQAAEKFTSARQRFTRYWQALHQ